MRDYDNGPVGKDHDDNLDMVLSLTDKIKEVVGERLEKVILFGSRARGDHREDSDYDIMVIGKFTDTDIVERTADLRLELWDFDINYDLLVLTQQEFDRSAIASSVGRDGVILYERQ